MPLKPFKTLFTPFLLLALLASFFPMPKPARAATLTKAPSNLGLVGYWPLDENTGITAGDSSGNGNTGTISAATWTNGKRGKALSFNGSSSYVSSPTISISNTITASAWVYSTNFNQNGFIVGKNNVNEQWEIFFEGPILRWRGGIGSSDTTFCTAPSNNAWHHVVGTQSGTDASLYIDGVLCDTGTVVAIGNGAGTIDIGRFNGGYYFNGLIDEVRLYNRALSATEISTLYRSGQITRKAVSERGLVGYWPLNEGRGLTAGDSSGNGNLATFYGSPTWSNGKRGKALSFNPSTPDYLKTSGTLGAPTTVTVSAWMKADDTASSGYRYVVGQGRDNYCSGYSIRYYNGNIYFDVNTNSGDDGCEASPNITYTDTNNWHHVVGVYDQTVAYLYVDGVLRNSASASISGPIVYKYSEVLNIGKMSFGEPTLYFPFDGLIDDVRVYNRALSATEVLNLYKQNETTINANTNNRLTNGLVGLWSFNGNNLNMASSTAEILDMSGNGNNGDNVGGVADAGKIGQGIRFNGSSSYVQVNNSASLNPSNITVSVWAKSDSSTWSDYGFLVSKRDAYIVHPTQNATGVAFYINNGAWTAVSCTPANPITDWNMYTLVWDGTNLNCYINDVAGTPTTPGGSINTSDTNALYIGKDSGLARYFNGSVDEVRIYNRALSASEIKQLYNLGK